MADLSAATQLPLFEKEPFAKPDLPVRWNSFGHQPKETLLTDLAQANLHLVSPIENREKRKKQDQYRDEKMFSLAARSHKDYDDVLAAYALYSDGRTDLAIFEDFAEKFDRALAVGLLNQWLERLKNHRLPVQIRAAAAGRVPNQWVRASSCLKNEPGLGRMLGIKTSGNVKPLT